MSDEYTRLLRKHRSEDDPKMIGLWKVGRTIGKGSSGRVRIARHTKSGQYAAVKIVSKQPVLHSTLVVRPADNPEHMLLSIEREIVIMKLIEHPNVMRLYDVWETSSELYLILEYVEGGELFDYLCTRGRLAQPEALGCFQQIIAAVDYCHRFGVAHRDLKPENLLMDKLGNIKVADFGMAAWQTGAREGLLQTACGSPHYAAPEVVMGRAYDGRASDIWSCGVILFALLAGRLPFDDEDLGTLLEKVKSGSYEMPSGIEADARDLIERMLQRDVEKRITMPDILLHPFFLSSKPKTVGRDMPDLDVLAKPVRGAEIDHDIFANLRTLWHGTAEEDIVEALESEVPNWQKGVYHLLVRYRNAHLENYEEEAIEREKKKRSRKMATQERRVHNGQEMSMVRTTSQATDLGRSPSSLPPRAAPPTPRRAGRKTMADGLSPLDAPQIVLHSPTPPRPGAMHSPLLLQYSPSPSPSPLSPNLPALTIPDVKDDKMQLFFQQIVEHLNAMEIRAGMTSAPASPQFFARSSPSPVASIEFGKQRQPVYNPNWDARSSRDPLAQIYGGMSPNVDNMQTQLANYAGQFGELDKENAQYPGVIANGVMKKSSLRNSDKSARRQPLRVQIVEPSPRKLSRKKSIETSPMLSVSPAWSDSSFSLPSTPRRRWLGNVFKFKPANYQLLSVHDAFTSREECRRLLVGIGVKVVLTPSEGNGVLKCKFEETKDPEVRKPVRFRVEVRDPTVQQAKAGFEVALQLIQEKGASSTFQIVCQRLRSMWELDVIRPQTGMHSPMFSPEVTEGGRFTEMMVYPD